ncbi:MAG: GntR family transcriptional regulator [Lachnospiraceae bacterium]|nr:GntR family transcriptional regulator [Lachnospiraceae bacterium]
MVSFEELSLNENSPIYLQIVRFVKQKIAAGLVQDKEEMPSRRVLSALLGVNPNTVQKAYGILEEEGMICSHSGAKSYMSLSAEKIERIYRELLENDTLVWIKAMKQMGVSRCEAVELLERLWKEDLE